MTSFPGNSQIRGHKDQDCHLVILLWFTGIRDPRDQTLPTIPPPPGPLWNTVTSGSLLLLWSHHMGTYPLL
jgi:hypothetical protein|uniref:Uncharacterized protein n=1 Tax=Picea sitchensis TaxID=3332 RepID=A0A6B9XVI7_PICSI|nr:hypothetical protein Q903MT_gene4225 [Picea sitchensis]